MNTRFVNKAFHITFILAFVLGMVGNPGKSAEAEQPSSGQRMADPMPRMDINLRGNQVYASGWIVGSEVTVSFDVPRSEKEWDYEKTVTVPEGWGAWCQFTIDIDPAEFRIAAGQVARISDGATTRQATLPDLRVTSEDPTVDTISGIAPPGTIVDLQSTGAPGGGFRRHPVADGSGRWFADFAHPGTGSDEQGTFEIMPGTGAFWVLQTINNFVAIRFFWDYGPAAHFFPKEERIETYVWPAGSNLTLTIDDPATPGSPDLTRTQMAQDGDMGAGFGMSSGDEAAFEDLGPILPGFVISVTDGLVTKTLTVTDLALTGVDPKTDTVTGTAEPGSLVDVRACGGGGCGRQVSAGSDRAWQADFSVPGKGEDEKVVDIHPGDEGQVRQADADGDATAIRWSVPKPRIDVSANQDYIEAWQWPLGNTITLEIDNPDTPLNPDYTDTQIVDLDPGNPDQTRLTFKLSGIYDIQPGYLFSLGDGITTKTLITTSLAFTDVDLEEDAISGIAEPGSRIRVYACDQSGCVVRSVNASDAGIWVADFAHPGNTVDNRSPFDIAPGTWAFSTQEDDDGDHTMFVVDISNPVLSVHPEDDWLEGSDWPAGVTVNISIDDPATSVSPDFTGSTVTGTIDWNPSENYFALFLSDQYDIQAGDLVIAEYGLMKKEHIVTNLVVTGIDSSEDTVSGTADPNVPIRVDIISDIAIWVDIESDSNGNWMADFTGQYDLNTGDGVRVQEFDSDNDGTADDGQASDPGMAAEPTHIVSTSTPALPATIPLPTPTPWNPIIVIVLIIVPLILIGLGIWFLGKQRKKGKE